MKKSIIIAGASAFTLIGLGGCVSAGNSSLAEETSASIGAKLEEGMPAAQVRGMLGDPATVSYTDGGLEIWKYDHMKGHVTASSFIPVVGLFSSGSKGTKKELVILFDEDNRVKKFNMSESAVESKSGIIPQ